MLAAHQIHREFPTTGGPLPVLKGIDLDVARRETVAVTGASGVGKSTLLHILGGLDRPTKGEVVISGVSLSRQSEKALAMFRNEKVGFVFQFHYLLEDFSARENVAIPLLVAGRGKSEAMSRGELLLGLVGLKDRADHRPHQLSGGEQQRVAVARALANDPDIVLADEPSGNLDTATGRKLHDLLFELNSQQGTTFLIATHNRELAGRCERKLEIVDGVLTNQNTGR
ncbi:MAG: ABC transporter ATP-binding protein [Candidatus Zixiibacteriota bacterium]|nr:MAG: ABC transporter ATP-binding protein [candidate division Zixibacteria bacterium]